MPDRVHALDEGRFTTDGRVRNALADGWARESVTSVNARERHAVIAELGRSR